MTKTLKTLIFMASLTGPAIAQEASDMAAFETPYGFSYGQQDRAYEMRGLRDANGNLSVINGRIQTDSSLGFGLNSEWGQTEGFGNGYASGMAIGNQLNVITQGNYNTVVVDSTQINNGNQTTVLNGELDLND